MEWPLTLSPVDDDGSVLALFLGRFGARKGIYDLVEACARLAPEQRARLRLVAAGDGEVDGVRAAVAAAGVDDVVEVAEWLDRAERDDLLRRAQVLVLPSSHEGLPMAVLEAMAYRVAPMVTPVGALPELVHDGVNGTMVPSATPPRSPLALDAVLADDERRRALGAPGSRRRRGLLGAAVGGAARDDLGNPSEPPRTLTGHAHLVSTKKYGAGRHGGP